MPKAELDGLPVIDTDDSEEIAVAVKAEDIEQGDESNPETAPNRHRRAAAARR